MQKMYADEIYPGYLHGVENLVNQGILKSIASGKTKHLYIEQGNIDRANESGNAIMYSTDDISAGNGAKKDVMIGKAASVIKTTYNIFSFLEQNGIPTSLVNANLDVNPNALIVRNTEMIPLEVVYRNLAWGSYLKRNISSNKGDEINVFELFLKTNDNNWKGVIVKEDDPFIKVYDDEWQVVDPTRPTIQYFMMQPLLSEAKLQSIESMTRHINKVLKAEFEKYGIDLIDFKVEYGYDPVTGAIILSDEFSPDNMRLFHKATGEQKDKDAFREGSKSLDNIAKDYKMIETITSHFGK
ncbi:MAG: phosphoribosylaminoimidazolesuccinocarboxamide synthase [Patescibacteria group bacterium]|nr:phosphoribosylaminoimidazolesuccinocarboxamide synthase [Patescibacteria group bacterium]